MRALIIQDGKVLVIQDGKALIIQDRKDMFIQGTKTLVIKDDLSGRGEALIIQDGKDMMIQERSPWSFKIRRSNHSEREDSFQDGTTLIIQENKVLVNHDAKSLIHSGR